MRSKTDYKKKYRKYKSKYIQQYGSAQPQLNPSTDLISQLDLRNYNLGNAHVNIPLCKTIDINPLLANSRESGILTRVALYFVKWFCLKKILLCPDDKKTSPFRLFTFIVSDDLSEVSTIATYDIYNACFNNPEDPSTKDYIKNCEYSNPNPTPIHVNLVDNIDDEIIQYYDLFINSGWDEIIPDNIITLSPQDKADFRHVTPGSDTFYENIINGLTFYAMEYLEKYITFFTLSNDNNKTGASNRWFMELDIYTKRGGATTAGYHQDTTNSTIHNYMRFLGLHFTSNVTYGTEISFLYPGEAIVNNECAFPSIRNLNIQHVIEYCKRLIWVDNLDSKMPELLDTRQNYLKYYEDDVSKTIRDDLLHLLETDQSKAFIEYYNTILCNTRSYRQFKNPDGSNIDPVNNLYENLSIFYKPTPLPGQPPYRRHSYVIIPKSGQITLFADSFVCHATASVPRKIQWTEKPQIDYIDHGNVKCTKIMGEIYPDLGNAKEQIPPTLVRQLSHNLYGEDDDQLVKNIKSRRDFNRIWICNSAPISRHHKTDSIPLNTILPRLTHIYNHFEDFPEHVTVILSQPF